jgi:hypothetical protein
VRGVRSSANGFSPEGVSQNLDPNFRRCRRKQRRDALGAATSAMPDGDKGTPGRANDPVP